jgi:uncharacterized lipoprotein
MVVAMTRLSLAVIALAACSTASGVQRFDDDYEAARVAAAHAKLPLAVEVWAPW